MPSTTNQNTKLKLSTNKLSLSNKIDVDVLKKAYADATHAATVEVKQNKVQSHFKAQENKVVSGELTAQEVSHRLEILKKSHESGEQVSQSKKLYKDIGALNKNIKNQDGISKTVKIYSEQNEQTLENHNKEHIVKSETSKHAPTKDNPQNDHRLLAQETKTGATSQFSPKTSTTPEQKADINPNQARHESVIAKYNKYREELEDEEREEENNRKKKANEKLAKLKRNVQGKVNKSQILNIVSEYEGDSDVEEAPTLFRRKRGFENRRNKKQQNTNIQKVHKDIICNPNIEVGELANLMGEKVTDVVKELMKLGIMAGSSYVIDKDTIELIADIFGHSVSFVDKVDVDTMIDSILDEEKDLSPRPPVVTIMGHVDHGKTSLLDSLRSTDVVSKEAGGITQHIGAYQIHLKDGKAITFIDTPGHEAFTAMRSRGAKITDIVVLVVAANDGIKPQTVEAINHAKAAGVPIIVAINKIDRHDADIEKVKQDLLSHNLIPEEYGGDVITVPVSALQKQNLDKLEEAILLIAELLNIRANYSANASGAVIEAKVDKNKGVLVTLLVQRGTLNKGDIIVAGSTYGKVKSMVNEHNQHKKQVMPGTPVEIMGFDQAPVAGDKFIVVSTDKEARDLAEHHANKLKKASVVQRASLHELLMEAAGNIKVLKIIVKADVQGSVEAIAATLNKIDHHEVKIQILHSAVGGITDSDVILAQASQALILGFNVRANNQTSSLAERLGVNIKYYSIIYDMIDDVKSIMTGMISPIIRETYLGTVVIKQVFNITRVGKVAGCLVTKGLIKRGAGARLLRDDIVIYEGKLKTLKRFKEDAKEVKENFECGVVLENYDDIKADDVIEVFEKVTTSGGKVT